MASTTGKTISCKAAICWEAKKPMIIETVEVSPPKKNEVRIKIVATGICRSDAHVLHGKDIIGPPTKYPLILGHEAAGIIESVGEGVIGLVPGDHVIPVLRQQCKNCVLCKNESTNLCLNYNINENHVMEDDTTRFTCKGQTIYHFLGTSTFSEYTVVHQYAVAKINPKVDLTKCCIIGCSVLTGYGSALNLAEVSAGTTCAIWGLGGVGFSVALGCVEKKPKRLIGIDINEEKFELAKKYGFTELINPLKLNEPIQAYLMKDGGVDFAFDCIGNINVLKDAYASLSMWGRLITVGIPLKDDVLPIKPAEFLFGRRIIGGPVGGYKVVDGVQLLVDKYINNELKIDSFVTSRLKLEQINEGFELLNNGKTIRTVILME